MSTASVAGTAGASAIASRASSSAAGARIGSTRSTLDTAAAIGTRRRAERTPICFSLFVRGFASPSVTARAVSVPRDDDPCRGHLDVYAIQGTQEGDEGLGVVGGEHAAHPERPQRRGRDLDRLAG